jgi:hypothetical protein
MSRIWNTGYQYLSEVEGTSAISLGDGAEGEDLDRGLIPEKKDVVSCP